MLKNKNTIIFDFDGTLVDTMHVFSDVASRLISEYYGMPKERARQMYFKTSGFPFCKQIEMIFPGHKLNQETASMYENEKLEATAGVSMDKETAEALLVLKNSGYNLAISSNNYQYNITKFVDNNKLNEIFKLSLGFKSGFGKGREHFDFIKNELGLNDQEMIFIGDSLNDYRLAKENNIDFIGKTGTFSADDFIKLDSNIKCITSIGDLII